MGTYRTLHHDALACPGCGREASYRIQFKRGFCWCDDVKLGATIDWETNLTYCYGRPTGGRLRIDGCPLEPCPHCGLELEAVLDIDDDRLVAVELVRDLPDLGPAGVLYLGGQRPVSVADAVWGRNPLVKCPHCAWKSDTCYDECEPRQVYCERCRGGITRSSWVAFKSRRQDP
jgi:hypothetical protein